MSPKLTWADRLKRYRNQKAEEYARTIMEPPKKATLYSLLRFPGVVIIMGDIRSGKTGLAHEIASQMHSRKKMPAVLHLPKGLEKRKTTIKRLVPPWMKVSTSRLDWPRKSVVIYDEAAQSAHSRRSQSGDALELDDLLAISGQRQQLILFIAHYSRKIDLNISTAAHRIIWKRPTYAHQLWERDELGDFVTRAYDFFHDIKGEVAKKRACLVLDLDNFSFHQTTNSLPSWWSDKLSSLFSEEISKRG